MNIKADIPNRIKMILTLATAAPLILMFQNCGAQFGFNGSSPSQSAAANGGSGSGSVNQPGGAGGASTGTAYQPGGGGPGPGTIAQPVAFTASNCSIPYPYSSSTPATNVIFNESIVMMAYSPQTTVAVTPGLTVNVWYGDEHAMTLGVRQVTVIAANGTSTVTNYPVSPLPTSPSSVVSPQLGSLALTGDQAGVDSSTCSGAQDNCARPMFPALFITDISANASSLAGDWQFGGLAIAPSAIYGSWKSAVKVVDHTQNPPSVTVTPDADPNPNNWNLGSGIPAPSNLSLSDGFFQSDGYGTLVTWNVSTLGLLSGHSYRMQFMVHDGDQHFTGGDVGQNCVNLQIP